MPGSPMKRQMRAELEHRTRERFPDNAEATHLDYVADWQAQGKFQTALARELNVSVAFLKEYLRLAFGASTVRETLTRAREEAAHVLAEDAVEIADAADVANVQVNRLQMQARQWLTEKWNPREFGQKQGVNVNINIGQLALAALQAPPPAAPALPSAPAPDAIAGAIADAAEILTIEESTTSDEE